MLKAMRKNVKSLAPTLWLVIAAFIITIFAVWGGAGRLGEARTTNTIAKVKNEKISADYYYQNLMQRLETLSNQFQDINANLIQPAQAKIGHFYAFAFSVSDGDRGALEVGQCTVAGLGILFFGDCHNHCLRFRVSRHASQFGRMPTGQLGWQASAGFAGITGWLPTHR